MAIFGADARYICVREMKRWLVWLSRIHRCQGFGVQSPSDFKFVREVINQHAPYPEYDRLAREMPGMKGLALKLCRLYFRIARNKQPQTIVNYGERADSPSSKYMREGCKTARMKSSFSDVEEADLMRMTIECDYKHVFEQALAHARQQSVLLIEGIKGGTQARAFWRKVQKDERTGVTFDLYYIGIVCFDKKRYKENHIVNF